MHNHYQIDIMSAKIKIKHRKSGNIAYMEHKGPYDSIPFDKYYTDLYSWAKENKARPGFKPMAIYMSNPNETPKDELVTLIAIPIGITIESKGDVKTKNLPEMDVAVFKHAAPAEEYENSYTDLAKWIEDNGFEVTDPLMEIYGKKPKVKNGKTIIFSDIQFPVKKK